MKITVKRYDPSKDNAPYETTYEVPHDDEYMTLLQALVYIHENEEPLAFDFSCRGRMCGRCAMMLDGEPVLACVEPLPDGSHTVEPLAGLPVVKDLVVDKSQVQEKIAETYKRVRVAPLTEEDLQTYNMEDADELFGINYCARCQVCTAGCPARAINPDYIGPPICWPWPSATSIPTTRPTVSWRPSRAGCGIALCAARARPIATSSRSIILPFGRSCAMPLLSAAS